MKTRNDKQLMRRCLELAAKGEGRTSPNPLVGCVIAKVGKTIAEGFHARFGAPHAEASALAAAGARAKGTTLYVNLEPCVAFGGKKMPSCAEAIARAGVKRVVCAMRDPNPRVNGRGFQLLRKAGVEVSTSALESEARQLNEPYAKFVSTRKPFVVLKMAVSLDGKIFSENTRQISNDEALRYVHQLRNRYDAILVGVGTVLKDDPRLTCRLPGGRDPLRVTVDSKLRVPTSAKVFADRNAIVFTTGRAAEKKKLELESKGIRVFSTGAGRKVNLKKVLRKLGEMKVASVLVEGGSEIATAFLNEKLVDKVAIAVAPKIFGKGVPLVGENLVREIELQETKIILLGDNAVFEGRPKR